MQTNKQKAQYRLMGYVDDMVIAGCKEYADLQFLDVKYLINRIIDLIFTPSDQKDKSEKRYFIEEFENRALGSFSTLIDELLDHREKIIEEARRDNYDEDEHEVKAA